jgi:hypothetical protein
VLGDPSDRGALQRPDEGLYEVTLRAGGATLKRTFRVEHGWKEETPGKVR